MNLQDVPIESPIEKKIAWAEDCYRRVKDTCLANHTINDLLPKLENAIMSSHENMLEIGIGEECGRCEREEGGSCCGRGLEDKYSGTLLLINLLMGHKIPEKRQDPESCFFLGKKGCLLLARHTICVNYLCKKITDKIHPQKIADLREKEGAELLFLFLLNEAVKQAMKGQNNG